MVSIVHIVQDIVRSLMHVREMSRVMNVLCEGITVDTTHGNAESPWLQDVMVGETLNQLDGRHSMSLVIDDKGMERGSHVPPTCCQQNAKNDVGTRVWDLAGFERHRGRPCLQDWRAEQTGRQSCAGHGMTRKGRSIGERVGAERGGRKNEMQPFTKVVILY